MFELEIELTPDADADEDIYDATATVARADVDRIAAQAAQIIEAFPARGSDDQ
jgi:hypothetical protein